MVAKRLVLDFYIPMTKSWSKKKRDKFNGCPHEKTPDIDNLVKAFLDSVYTNDCHVYQVFATKHWVEEGKEGVNVAEIVDDIKNNPSQS
jgi:Holliday junction resolvase RusA-like endonuclease